jgi:DNA-binding response OmpR family regulator
MSTLARILYIEPISHPQESLRADLEKREYFVSAISNEQTAVERIKADALQIVIVDALAAAHRGEEICRTIRLRGVDQPILLLLPEGDKPSPKVQADMVLIKPFTIRKVVNRIEKLLAEPNTHILQVGDIQLNCRTRLVRQGNRPLQKLTPKQTKLLETLMRHPGEVLTRRFLMKHVWQTDYLGDTRTLDVHIRWIREKIEPDPSAPTHIVTRRRIGYLFALPEAESIADKTQNR